MGHYYENFFRTIVSYIYRNLMSAGQGKPTKMPTPLTGLTHRARASSSLDSKYEIRLEMTTVTSRLA